MYSSIWLCAINPTDQSLFCQARKFCPQGTNQNDLLNLERVHMIFHSSTWEQLSVEYTSTCSQVEFKSTNASQALEYRCRSSTWVQMPVEYRSTDAMSSTWVQMPVEYRSTDPSRVHEYRCHVNWAVSTNVPAEVHTQRQPSITLSKSNAHWRGITKYKFCTQKYCCNVKIQCSLERNH